MKKNKLLTPFKLGDYHFLHFLFLLPFTQSSSLLNTEQVLKKNQLLHCICCCNFSIWIRGSGAFWCWWFKLWYLCVWQHSLLQHQNACPFISCVYLFIWKSNKEVLNNIWGYNFRLQPSTNLINMAIWRSRKGCCSHWIFESDESNSLH